MINMQLIHVDKHCLKIRLYRQLTDFKQIYIYIYIYIHIYIYIYK